MEPLPELPSTLVAASGQPLNGLWAGRLDVDPRAGGARRGRRRSWSYAAATGEEVTFGAAIVHLGYATTAFAFLLLEGRVHTWESKGIAIQAAIGRTAGTRARFSGRGASVRIGADGGLSVDVPVQGERLRMSTVIEVKPQTIPATLLTETSGGGWNATQKVAGESVTFLGSLGTRTWQGSGLGWRDWTAGSQDRRTTWRWAAGCGQDQSGAVAGLNVSTGMNEHGPGENVVWWDGRPHPLDVEVLGPRTSDLAGPWRLAGPGWDLDFLPTGARSARDNVLVAKSSYTQPIGMFTGTLPSPFGPREVELRGVTEHHVALW